MVGLLTGDGAVTARRHSQVRAIAAKVTAGGFVPSRLSRWNSCQGDGVTADRVSGQSKGACACMRRMCRHGVTVSLCVMDRAVIGDGTILTAVTPKSLQSLGAFNA